jgi:hypothetical protein
MTAIVKVACAVQHVPGDFMFDTSITHRSMRHALLAIAVLALLSGCGSIQTQPPSIDVSGRVSGVSGTGATVPDFVLSLAHTQPAPEPHLAFKGDPGIQDVRSISLAATASTGLPFAEEWHFIHISNSAQRPGGQPVILEFTGDPGWLRANVGDLAWLIVRKNDIALPSDTFSNFTSQPPHASGTTILARVEDDDPVLPWTRATCDATQAMPLSATLRPLAPAGGADCFDMQSLTSALLNNIAIAVTNALIARGDARATGHSIAIVPHVPSKPVAGGAPLPGFGFVYRTTLEPVVNSSGVGAFTGTLTVSVPITSHWRRTSTGTLTSMLDPVLVFADQTMMSPTRVTVNAVDGSISAAFANSVRTGVAAAVTAAPLPTGPGGIGLPAFLDLLFTLSMIQPSGGLPENFSLLAIPENRTLTGTPQNIAMTMGPIPFVNTTLATPAPGGVGARTTAIVGGAATVTQNLNAAGTSVRVFTMPAPTEPMPFRLVLLK